jgi:hypothetical protein
MHLSEQLPHATFAKHRFHEAGAPNPVLVEKLAERLHWKMEYLDPGSDEETWSSLSEHAREFYRICVRDLLREPASVDIARR